MIKKTAKEIRSELGRIGGKAIAKKLGRKGMAELGRKGALKRWKNQKKNERKNKK